MSKIYRNNKKSGFKSFLTGAITLFAVVGIAFGIAALWQSAEDTASTENIPPSSSLPVPEPRMPELETTSVSSSAAASIAVVVSSTVDNSSILPSDELSSSTPDESSVSEPDSSITAEPISSSFVRPEYSYALPQTPTKAPKSYFDDVLFFGDSLSVGIPLYHVMDNAAVIAFQGINPININTKETVDINGDGNRMTMLDAATALYPDRDKIYIMLGGNGLDLDEESFIGGYKTFLQSVKAAYPKAKIFLQTITPVTDNAHIVYPSVSNEKINRYNLAIMALAQEENVYFVDVAAALMNDEGKLPLEASPADGMHLGGEYYHKWFDYLMYHTVEE